MILKSINSCTILCIGGEYMVEIETDAEPIKLCNQNAEAPDGYIVPEIVNNYLYFVNKNDDSKYFLYRVDINSTETVDAIKLIK